MWDSGFDPSAVLSAIETPEIKAALKRATDDVLARNVFGTPTFIVGGELFFGKDRLQFVEDALRDETAVRRPT